jgi:hypothetical protein
MSNAIKVLLQMQSGFLQLESTLVNYLLYIQLASKKKLEIYVSLCLFDSSISDT